MTVDEFQRLHEHSVAAATRIIDDTFIRLNQFGNEFDDTSGRIKFAIFFSSRRGISLQKIFVDAADKILFMKKFFVKLVDVVDKMFDSRLFRTKRGKKIQGRAPFKASLSFSMSAIALSMIAEISFAASFLTI